MSLRHVQHIATVAATATAERMEALLLAGAVAAMGLLITLCYWSRAWATELDRFSSGKERTP